MFSHILSIRLILAYLFAASVTVVGAPSNQTVDDSDTFMYQYHPESCSSAVGWRVLQSSHFSGGSSHFCNEFGSFVMITFSGTAFYLLSPRWPYPIGMNVSIDGGPSHYINLTDPDAPTNFEGNITVPSLVIFSALQLQNIQHTVAVKNATSKNGSFDLYADDFIVTTEAHTNNPVALPVPTESHSSNPPAPIVSEPTVSEPTVSEQPPNHPGRSPTLHIIIPVCFLGFICMGLSWALSVYCKWDFFARPFQRYHNVEEHHQ